MYHYVRRGRSELPFHPYLHVDDFRRQLDHFAATGGFVSRAAFLAAMAEGRSLGDGYVLTFDDALADHHDAVLPELLKRGLWGLFYVPTGIYADGRMLDVHRIHHLLGAYGGKAVLHSLRGLILPHMLRDEAVEAFRNATYTLQDNDAATGDVKRMLNYYIAYEYREAVIDALVALHPGTVPDTLYMSLTQVKDLQDAGMLVGSHSVSHRLMSKLPIPDQAEEIDRSFAVLETAAGGLTVRSFCYPYGGFHSFTADTERLLAEAGCRFAFNVEPRDVTDADVRDRPLALPRYDCNLFPHGRARIDGERETP